ncbi:MAG TPA: hypothetical protein VL201_00825, partial [Patescibacteria group bacterium]|nr:hypothetical protein [Patescibacteria group bacterium]
MHIIHLLLLSTTLTASSIFASENKKQMTLKEKIFIAGRFASNLISKGAIFTCKTVLIPHNILEHISTCVHEHAHGLASGKSYILKMEKQNNILQPWKGATLETTDTFFSTLAGPIAGVSTTYIQTIGLNIAKGYLENQPLNISFNKGLRYPIAFFPTAINTGIKYGSLLINP